MKNITHLRHKALIMALMASCCFVSSGSAYAQLKAANTATTVTAAPNGVPVVNIANPNASGLSNNQFTDYNVDSKGLVLNNQDASKLQVQSQLAGAVSSNPNLKSEATVILNQVVSTNRSVLAGYTEVVGGTADVVVANPNGITCSGCGFINTSHATLTTGTPVIANGGAGALTGFNVNAGDILITGQGLDASTTDYIALFARSLEIQGQINAKYLDIIAGANNIDYASKAVTGSATATGTAPTLAIDSSLLGGMYANTIRLIATEAGVGVRMLGDASAGAGDFTLTANGKVDLESHISAQGNLQVTSSDTSSADSIKLTDANLDSQGDTTLTAANGNIHLIGGLLDSQGGLTLQSGTLTDESDANSIIINSQNYNNVRYAAGVLTLNQSGATTLDGTNFNTDTTTGGALGITAGSLSIGANGENLYGHTTLQVTTTGGDMALAGAALESTGNLSLTSTDLISTTAASGENIVSTAGNVSLSAGNGLNNGGTISANAGSLTVNANNSIINSGLLEASSTGTFNDLSNTRTESIDNSGSLEVGGSLLVGAAALTNEAGGIMGGTTGSTFTLSSLDNAGTLIGSTTAANSATINTGTLTNESTGIIQSAGDLTLNAAGAAVANYNNIIAGGNLSLSALTLTNGSSTNSAATIQAATGSTFNISSLDNFGTVTGSTDNAGSATFNINSFNASALTNEATGIIQSSDNLALYVSQSLGTSTITNSHYIIAGGDLQLDTAVLTNNSSGIIQAGTGSTFTLSSLANSGALIGSSIASGGLTTITTNHFTNDFVNTGAIESGGDLTLSSNDITNGDTTIPADGTILANGALTVTATTLTNNSGSGIEGVSGSTFTLTTLTNNGTIVASGNSADAATINANTLANSTTSSTIRSAGDLTLNINNTLTNSDDIIAGGNLTLDASNSVNTLAITNDSTGVLQASNTLGISGTSGGTNVSITQNGELLGNALSFNLPSLTNNGTIQGGSGASSITVGGMLTNNSGALLYLATANSASTVTAASLYNNGMIESNGSITFDGDFTNSRNSTHQANDGIIYTPQSLTFNATNNMTNNYQIIAGGNLAVNGTSSATEMDVLNESGGTMQAGGKLSIGTTGDNNVTIGYMQTGTQIDAQSGNLIGNSLSFNLLSLINSGTIQSTIGAASSITVQNTLTNNAGGLINVPGGGGSTIADITAATVTNSGIFQSTDQLIINASDTLTNNSTGIIQSPSGEVTLNVGKTLTNDNDILSGGELTIAASSTANTLDITNASTGIVQAADTLSITGSNGTGNNVTLNNTKLTTHSGTLIAGLNLDFILSSLTNSGIIQGGIQSNNIITAATLTNNAGAVLDVAGSITGGGTITSSNLTNNGTLQSDGSLDLELGTSTLTDAASDKIIAQTNLTINAGSLSMGNSASAIIADQSEVNVVLAPFQSYSGGGTITLTNDLTNGSFLFSGGNLNVTAPHIINTSTGAIAAHGTVNITSTGPNDDNFLTCSGGLQTSASILNCGGALYAGTALNMSSNPYNYLGLVSDPAYRGTFVNEAGGTVNSSGSISIHAGTFYNYNNINASGDIDIATGSSGFSGDTGTWGFFTNSNTGTTPASIVSGGTLTIENFYEADNVGSKLAASTIVIQHGDTFSNTAVGGITAGIYTTDLNTSNNVGTLNNSTTAGNSLTLSVSSTANSGTPAPDGTTTSGTTANGVLSASSTLAGSSSLLNGGSSVGGASSASGTSPLSGASSFTLGGVHITLPTNPNGEFIINPNPNTGPLIETNPEYGIGSAFLGANYMIQTYGVDPSTVERELGDANYQASLISQQIVGSGASALLGTTNQAAALQQLMTNGDTVGKTLGLTIGVAPTAAELANLSTSMVWMVDTVVDGQHVLAPVVYLSAATKSQILSGAVIQATDANIQVGSLNNNSGSTISASNNLSITTFGDLNNTSATITGGNVALASLGGNIVNQTSAITTGSLGNQSTVIGATGVISATGNLSLNAANNILNLGANMSAGGNASLNAGNDITFGTIQNLTSTTSTSHSGSLFNSSDTTTVNTTVTNIGSNLKVGGNLVTNSGRDTTIQGSNVNVTGDGSMTTGGNLNILDAQNIASTSSTTLKNGLGVGGGLVGAQMTTDTDVKGTSVGSNLNFGGNASLNAGNVATIQGSNLNTAGNLSLNAQTVNVLAAQNTDVSTHTVDTTTLFSTSGGNSSSGSSGANTNYTPTTQQTGMGQTQANAAGANANAGENASATGLTLLNHTTTTTVDASSTAVGSNIKTGGNLTVNSTGDTTLVGANLAAGGDASLNAGGSLNILAAQNTHTVTTSTDSQSLGLYASSQNNATSGANGGYSDGATGGAASDLTGNVAGTSTGSGAAGGQASSNNTLNLVDVNQTGTTTTDITHTGSTITSGGNTSLGATNDINIAGSSVNAAGNLSATAGGNLNVTAVQDSHTVTTNGSDTTAGLYADGSANASASGSGEDASKYGGVNTQASGTAAANANAGVGLQASNTTSSSTTGSTTAVTSSLTSGGDMTRTAGGTITDQGTQINAGGSLTQSAAAWNSIAAQNTTFSTTGSATNTAQLGLYAGANGSQSGTYNQQATTTGQSPSASAGLSAAYQQNTSGSSSATSTAVVSNIHTGGGFTSTTTGATALQGTNVTAGGDLNVNAASLTDTAAQNTSTSSNSSGNINASLQVGEGTSGYSGALAGGASALGTTNSSTTAVVGSLTSSGGNLKVSTTGDQTYEGTNLSAANGAATIQSGGNVTFNAAQNTTSSSQNYQGFTAGISGNEKGGQASFNGGTNSQNSASTTAVTSTITAGSGGLTVNANNALTLQGTNLNSGGDVTLGANTLNYTAAQNTSSNSQATQTLNVAASGSSGGSKGGDSGAAAGSYVNTNTSNSSTTAVVGGIKAGGNLNVTTTGDQTYTGTNIAAGGDANISSGSGAVSFNQAQNTANSSSTQWGASASASSTSNKDGGTTQQAAAGGGYQTNSSATTTGVASNITTGGTLDVTSNKDLTLQGTNITSGGDTTLQSTGGSVNYQALTSTATGSGFGVNAQVSGTDTSSGKTPGSTASGQVGGNYSSQNDVTQTAGSIHSGGGVAVIGNQNVTLVGTNVTSTGATTVAATNGNVNIQAATSTKNDQSYAAALGVKNTSSGSGAGATSNNAYSGGVDVNVNETSTETGATFKTGSLNVSSGKDTNLTGTSINSTGDTSLNAGGNLNLTAAQSTNGGVNLNASVVQAKNPLGSGGGTTAIPLIQSAGVNGGSNSQGVSITSGGNLNTTSGGATTMQATQANVGGSANIDAAGGVNNTSTTSGGVDLGFKLSAHPTGAASLDLPSTGTTSINAKGGTTNSTAKPAASTTTSLSVQQTKTIATSLTTGVTTASSQLQSSLTSILNNANLSTTDKFTKMTAAITNDPTLSATDKSTMLAAIATQQKSLSSGAQTTP